MYWGNVNMVQLDTVRWEATVFHYPHICSLTPLINHLSSGGFYTLKDKVIFCSLALRFFNWQLRCHTILYAIFSSHK